MPTYSPQCWFVHRNLSPIYRNVSLFTAMSAYLPQRLPVCRNPERSAATSCYPSRWQRPHPWTRSDRPASAIELAVPVRMLAAGEIQLARDGKAFHEALYVRRR